MLGQANPIPNLDDYELDDLGSATLARLEAQMSASEAPATIESRFDAGRLALIAATIVLLAGVAFVLLRQGDGSTVVTDPKPDTTVAETSSTTTTTTTTSTVAPPTTAAVSALDDIAVWLGAGDGQWTPAQASVPFAFTTVGGWNSANVWNTPERFTICVPQANSPARSRCIDGSVSVLLLDEGDVESTRDFLLTFDGAATTDEEPVTIGGATGIRFRFTNDIQGTPGGQVQGDIGVPPAVDYGSEQIPIGVGPRGAGIVSIVDVGGTTMTIVFQGEEAARGAPEDGFNTYMAEGLKIIDSILWEALQ